MKKIFIDAYQYSSSITGTDRMAFNFLRELQKIDSANKYYILCSREKYTRSVVAASNFKVVKPPLVCILPFAGKYFSYIWRRLNKLFIISQKADTYYSFHNMALPGRRVAKRMIASNLDLIPIVLDEYKHIGRQSPEEQLTEYRRVASVADCFVSISNFSRDELSRMIGVEKSKIKVIYLAADKSFGASGGKQKLDVPKGFVLTIGGSEPRKNVSMVIEAHKQLPEKLRQEHKLVIAGGRWHGVTLEGIDNNIINLGYISDAVLTNLYSEASAFVFASRYEGFGFAILEAMASKTPVINARGSSLNEVSGDATLTFQVESVDDLKKYLERLLNSPPLQEKLVSKGLEQNAKFSWEKSAQDLHRLLIQN